MKKAQLNQLREGLLEVIHGPVYLAFCVFGTAQIVLSALVSALGPSQQDPMTRGVTVFISLVSLVVPCLMLWLRKTHHSGILRGLAVYARVMYVLCWALVMAVIVLIDVILAAPDRQRLSEALHQTDMSAGRYILAGLEFLAIPVLLVFNHRMAGALKEAARIMDKNAPEKAAFRPAERIALIWAVCNAALCVVRIATDAKWLYAPAAVQPFLLWLTFREAANRMEGDIKPINT